MSANALSIYLCLRHRTRRKKKDEVTQYLPSRRLPSNNRSQPNIQGIFIETEHEQTVIEVKIQALDVKWKGRSLLFRESGEGSWRRRQINQKGISMHLKNFFVAWGLGIAHDTPSKM